MGSYQYICIYIYLYVYIYIYLITNLISVGASENEVYLENGNSKKGML